MKNILSLSLDNLQNESVLVQAWKKAIQYIRYNNWYSDILEIDYQSTRLPIFLKELSQNINDTWENDPIDFVPAPKSQNWGISKTAWGPISHNKSKIRPLANISLRSQIVTTAIMMCLANDVESKQGDPCLDSIDPDNRKKVISYGNRLFCDYNKGAALYRWGSNKLYRKYYSDYQTFSKRPYIVAEQNSVKDAEIAIVQSDLSQFYDRVRPQQLLESILKINQTAILPTKPFLEKALCWRWKDEKRAIAYSDDNGIEGFENVALPQGLVASGFFANIFLLDFDSSLIQNFGEEIGKDIILLDAARYVDDLRIVLRIPCEKPEEEIEKFIFQWLSARLPRGLQISPQKTFASVLGRDKRFTVRQSAAATRIEHDLSGPIDAAHGTELLNQIQSFFHLQKRFPFSTSKDDINSLLIGRSDFKDETAARFAAGKFRRTFRSLRPLLEEATPPSIIEDYSETIPDNEIVMSQNDLDEKSHLFAAMLLEEWIKNPANIRLLRVALDIYPDVNLLECALKLLNDSWRPRGCRGAQREIKLYCLAELFKAGATETGIVQDEECLPANVDLSKYHDRLYEEANDILEATNTSIERCPWYLSQQIYLYLIVQKRIDTVGFPPRSRRLKRYREFYQFITESSTANNLEQRICFAIIRYSLFSDISFITSTIATRDFKNKLAEYSPELWVAMESNSSTQKHSDTKFESTRIALPDLLQRYPQNPFLQENNFVKLAWILSNALQSLPKVKLITPWEIVCILGENSSNLNIDIQKIEFDEKNRQYPFLFTFPSWAETDQLRKKFQLGILLRFSLRGNIDFFRNISQMPPKESLKYKPVHSHWLQLKYGNYNGNDAFAPSWVALSSWVNNFLWELLQWPGTRQKPIHTYKYILKTIEERQNQLKNEYGTASNLYFHHQTAPKPTPSQKREKWTRPLRIGIVQSVLPQQKDYESNGPLLDEPKIRKRMRKHLALSIAALKKILVLRNSHKESIYHDFGADLIVFPELAIHPSDVKTYLYPLVNKFRCIVFAGLVYHHRDNYKSGPVINSAIWLIPEWSDSEGLCIREIQQGKQNLAPAERTVPQLESFRPTQWIIDYQWTSSKNKQPLRISGAICYDSTDLKLCSDLCNKSDLFIITAFNQDVSTFDRMSEALHYHMYQPVLIVNNGEFGGSSCYVPYKDSYRRQLLHLHGQPQAQIAFVEFEDIKDIKNRGTQAPPKPVSPRKETQKEKLLWKTPPAGIKL